MKEKKKRNNRREDRRNSWKDTVEVKPWGSAPVAKRWTNPSRWEECELTPDQIRKKKPRENKGRVQSNLFDQQGKGNSIPAYRRVATPGKGYRTKHIFEMGETMRSVQKRKKCRTIRLHRDAVLKKKREVVKIRARCALKLKGHTLTSCEKGWVQEYIKANQDQALLRGWKRKKQPAGTSYWERTTLGLLSIRKSTDRGR